MYKTTLPKVLPTFILCYLMWLLFTWSLAAEELIAGVVVAAAVSLFTARFLINDDPNHLLNLSRLGSLAFYSLFVFIGELWKANMDVALRAFKRKIPLNPGIVRIPTALRSEYGQAMLASSITLTPGTITMDVEEDAEGQAYFYVHWIDVTTTDPVQAGEAIKGRMEKHIRRIWS